VEKDTKRTLITFGLGLLLAALGFLYLWRGSLTAAPILIIGGYLVVIISLIPFKSEEK
jgi:dipeptide/tripeptide permease